MSHNKDRRARLSSRGSDHSRAQQPLRGVSAGAPTQTNYEVSGQSAGVIPFQGRGGADQTSAGSYKRNSNSPLRRSKDGAHVTRGASAGVHEFDQKVRDRTPPSRLLEEPMRDNYMRPTATGFQDQTSNALSSDYQ